MLMMMVIFLNWIIISFVKAIIITFSIMLYMLSAVANLWTQFICWFKKCIRKEVVAYEVVA